jgi:hypothetical protein
MSHYLQDNQIINHVSQATCFETDQYMLNHQRTPVRYWIETNPSYGQRVIRQVYNNRQGNWFNPKPVTKYARIALLFNVIRELDLDEGVVHGTSVHEPVAYVTYNLLEEGFESTDNIKAFLDYYIFDDYQRKVILDFIGEGCPAKAPVVKEPKSYTRNETLQELRRVKLEYEQERLRSLRLRNDALELRVNARRQKQDAKPNETSDGQVDDNFKKLSTHYARTGDGFSDKQLRDLKKMALADPNSLPGTLQPFHLSVMNPIMLAAEAGKPKVDERQQRAAKLATITDSEEYERVKKRYDAADASYEERLKYYAEQNLIWYNHNKED